MYCEELQATGGEEQLCPSPTRVVDGCTIPPYGDDEGFSWGASITLHTPAWGPGLRATQMGERMAFKILMLIMRFQLLLERHALC